MMMRHIVIVGGGYSGTLTAIQLLSLTDARVTLIEPARPARGAAYGTNSPYHLLNVRAAGMSAYPDRPSHFADWLTAKGLGGPESFAERRVYGAYLEEELSAARAIHGERLQLVEGEAANIIPGSEGETVLLSGGQRIIADRVILAVGNLAPDVPGIIAQANLPDGIYIADPWAGPIAKDLDAADTVLLIGTGLTAVDAALSLDAAGFKGRILALSRRGLLPRAHAEPAPPPQAPEELASRCTALLRAVRAAAQAQGWRGAVDSLRPHTQRLWEAASEIERRRFLRHLRPWWDVHRHRIAPAIAARLDALITEGRLQAAAGRIVSVDPQDDGALVRYRPRGGEDIETRAVRRIVNCTGPQSDIARARNPLIRALHESGRIRPDSIRIGIDVDTDCHAVDRDGKASPTLFVAGPMTKSRWWEIVAVPDLRVQVRGLAERVGEEMR